MEEERQRNTTNRRSFLKTLAMALGIGAGSLALGREIGKVEAVHEDPTTPTTLTDEEIDVQRLIVGGMHPVLPYDAQLAWDLPADISESAPNDYLSPFGSGLVRFASGNLGLVYRAGSTHLNDGIIRLRISTDGGRSWSAPTTIFSDATYDLRNFASGITPSGRFILAWVRYDSGADTFFDMQYAYSDDEGTTWSGPFILSTSGANRFSFQGKILSIADGRLAMFYYDQDIGAVPANATDYVIFSDDDGVSWSGEVAIVTDSALIPSEPAAVYLGGGVIILLARKVDSSVGFRAYRSIDNGATWSDDGDTNFETAHSPDNPVWMDVMDAPSGERMAVCSWYCRVEDIVYVITGNARDLSDDASVWILGTQTNLDGTVTENSGYASFVLRGKGLGLYGIVYEAAADDLSAVLHFYGWNATRVYTPTNVTTDRSYDADATTVAELADILGTLIADLRAQGILQ